MRVLLVDHEDSFTYNLVNELGALTGQAPRVLSSFGAELEALLRHQSLEEWDLVILGPGPGHPARSADHGLSPQVIAAVERAAVPLFGVCFGLQLLVSFTGGSVMESARIVHGKAPPLTHDRSGLFEDLSNPARMMRYHSLVADRATLPVCWRVTAESAEGEVMALEHRLAPWWAVQFHPESVGSEDGGRLLANLLSLARRARSGRAQGIGERPWNPSRS